MGYIITYPSTKKFHQDSMKCRRSRVLIGILLIILFLTCLFGHTEREYLQSLLIPGDPTVTVAAMEDFSQSLKAGMALKDGFSIFCKQILEGAGVAPD